MFNACTYSINQVVPIYENAMSGNAQKRIRPFPELDGLTVSEEDLLEHGEVVDEDVEEDNLV